ncbi:MAG: threonine/serine exporter family protein [Clostridia bacterium]|nr:threonine/serine exporter family protein [Clostridia bacterium]
MQSSLSQRQVLDIVSAIGYRILRFGGEANRAEDTVTRIGRAYGMNEVHVFAIATSILITVEKDGESMTQTRRISKVSTDLDKLDKINSLSRKICSTETDFDTIMNHIREIDQSPKYPSSLGIWAYALIGGSFSVFFGGGVCEFMVGFIVGALIRFVKKGAEFLQSPPFVTNAAGAAATVSLIKICTFFFPSLNISATTIGVLMILVPGVLLTNCIRDFVATDYTAGTAKIMETFLVAAAIALGVGVSVFWR